MYIFLLKTITSSPLSPLHPFLRWRHSNTVTNSFRHTPAIVSGKTVLAIIIFISLHTKHFFFSLLTNWIMPQTEMIKPQRDSLGPQIFILPVFCWIFYRWDSNNISPWFFSYFPVGKIGICEVYVKSGENHVTVVVVKYNPQVENKGVAKIFWRRRYWSPKWQVRVWQRQQ